MDQEAGEFELRSLRSEAELDPWLDLVVEVFGPLAIPRQYFQRHWDSDTDASRQLAGILVAVERASGRMVATVRVFSRALRIGGDTVPVGGIGEVSTLPAFRRRGLATALLKRAIRYMHAGADPPFACSTLHAASAAAAIYRRLGWADVATPLHRISVPALEAADARGVAEFHFEADEAGGEGQAQGAQEAQEAQEADAAWQHLVESTLRPLKNILSN